MSHAVLLDANADATRQEVDWWLLLPVLALLSMGLVFTASASVGFAAENYGNPHYFLIRYSVYLMLGLLASTAILRVPLQWWYSMSPLIFLGAVSLLILVLVPTVGREVKGATRWLSFGPLNLQVAEVAKFALIVFLSGYLVRRGDELRSHWSGFSKPILVLSLLAGLLIVQPDFGSIVVLAGVTFGLLFIAGVHIGWFLLTSTLGVGALVGFVVTSDYRTARVKAFLDPWADQFDTGYQLTNSFIAFGRGEWFGLGLGNSIQKLSYLPEAHTDFVISIISEELGMMGVVAILLLFVMLVGRLFLLGKEAIQAKQVFGGYIAMATGLMFAIQALINVAVACGLVPTKGLTLPFVSYGGSSLLICLALSALCYRVSMELPARGGQHD